MTRVFLAAGVAALAIAAPATAGPHGGGKGDQQAQRAKQQAQAVQRRNGGGGGGQAMRAQTQARVAQRQQVRPRQAQVQTRVAAREQVRANRVQAQNRVAVRQQQQVRANRVQAQRQVAERQQQVRANRVQAQKQVAQRQQQVRANRVQAQKQVAQRQQQARANRVQAQKQVAQRQQVRANRIQAQQQMAQRQQQVRANRTQAQQQIAQRQQLQANRQMAQRNAMAQRQQLRAERQMGAQNLLAERRGLRPDRIANVDAFRTSRFAALTVSPQVRTRVIAPAEAVRFVGEPVRNVTNFVALSALPASVSYLYPATPAYYYQYGDGYLYQVDRRTSLIDALIPLLAGGFLPGTYLPQPYMSSYVPSYYGLNSFYPASYDYGYGRGNVCNRYAYGVVYQVDCFTGMVEDVVPLYAGGYGVGQMLPSAYNYYNVPLQYRSMYYPTADYSYWYAPGAIYQVDPRSSMITSVAALMSPGFTIGQPLPAGYGMYNVPLAYRATYYDTPNAWYRYNNGYIYQVDPSTMLVGAVVASLLT
jgi:hypothetical protein